MVKKSVQSGSDHKETKAETFLSIGSRAPLFTLKNHLEEEVSLQQLLSKGMVVLYFYPKAMTSGCTIQACEIRDHFKEFKNLKVTVVGISPDKPASLKKFIDRDQLPFLLLSDEEHAVANDYKTWVEKSMYGRKYFGVSRTTYIIGSDGFIRHVIPKANTKTHHQDVLDWLHSSG